MKFGKNCDIWSKLAKIVKSGQKCEIWSKLSNVVNVGRGYVMNVGKRLCNPERLISQGVTKVGIELLGQLKN